MSPLLRAFVNERLTAAVDEIFQVFEGAIAKYEEEASSSKQEIERLRGLLLELENQRTDVSQSCACKDETTHEHSEQESSVSVHQRELQLPHIKQEDPEVWASDQQEENQTGEETDVSDPPQSSVCEESEQEDTKPLVQPQMQNCELEEEFQEMRVAKTEHFESPPTSTLTASFPSEQMQTEQSQTSLILSREFTDSSHLNLTGADYQCHLCAESFSSSHQLTNHAFRIHSTDVRIVCAVCGKAFESTESLHVHVRSHESSKCCHMCGKHCKSTTTLTEHMASHAGLKLHRCHVCGRECSRKGDLKIHMRIHTGEKPFCCSVCCKSFTHSGHLKKHMRSHTGERPYRCEVCGRGFLQSAHLKYHLGTHKQ